MPVCTTCAYRADYLYTTYRTKSNIRLNVCRCSAFLDPLIEHPPILLILDLILLKPRVFLHLLYNRGTRPLDATIARSPAPQSVASAAESDPRGEILQHDLSWLVIITLVVESIVRYEPNATLQRMVGRVVGVSLEMLAQYAIATVLALGVLYLKGWWPGARSSRAVSEPKRIDGRRENFRPILIPLTLLYTSILPLLLHLLLSIWYQPPATQSRLPQLPMSLITSLPAELVTALQSLLHVWSTTDRIWAGTRLLGGMSAGFGLRVVLSTEPWETTGIVLAGWAAAAGVAAGLAS